MGIKSITKLLKLNSLNGIKHIHIDKFRDKRIAIDASLYIYQSLINIPNTGNGKSNNHILGIYNKTIYYLSYGIKPIYIFDGKPPDDKYETIMERKKKAYDAKIQMDNSTDVKEKERLNKLSIRIKKEHIDDIKELLEYMGISYIHIDGEAEAIASELCRIKYVDYVLSEDMDALVYGCPNLVRSCIDKKHKSKDTYTIFNKEQILEDIGLNQNEFIELCILCGCDYCPNIPKIGIIKALQIIKEKKCIQNFIDNNNKYKLPPDYLRKYKRSIEIFNSYKGIFNENIPICESNTNISKLINLLIKTYNIPEKRVYNSIKKIHVNL